MAALIVSLVHIFNVDQASYEDTAVSLKKIDDILHGCLSAYTLDFRPVLG
jgi:hypothetical protein